MEEESSREIVRIAFRGPAVDGGFMSVRDLAPSLLAFCNLLQDAHKVLTDNSEEISVDIETNIHKGSVELILAVYYVGRILELIMHKVEIKDIVEVIIGAASTGGGLFHYIKESQGKKEIFLDQIQEKKAKTKVVFKDGTFELFRAVTTRKTARKFIGPLRRGGIEQIDMYMGKERNLVQIIKKKDIPCFDELADGEESKEVSVENLWAVIVTPQLEGDRRWWFRHEGNEFSAIMEDRAFLKKVHEEGVGFTAHDKLNVRRRTVITRQAEDDSTNQPKETHFIEKVIDRVSLSQGDLFKYGGGRE